jgi:hypothetical protein
LGESQSSLGKTHKILFGKITKAKRVGGMADIVLSAQVVQGPEFRLQN